MKSTLTLTNLRTPTIRTYGRFRNLSKEPWTFRKAFYEALEELKEQTAKEYNGLRNHIKRTSALKTINKQDK